MRLEAVFLDSRLEFCEGRIRYVSQPGYRPALSHFFLEAMKKPFKILPGALLLKNEEYWDRVLRLALTDFFEEFGIQFFSRILSED
jgi:hypothetical protein